jgi:PAS domain S-box-containing protein
MDTPVAITLNEEKLLDLFSSFKDGIITIDENYIIDSVNPNALKLLRMSEPLVKGKRLPALFPSNQLNLENFLQNVNSSLNYSDYRNYFPEHQRWFQFRAYPFNKEFSVFIKDVSGQIQNEQILSLEREVHLMQATQATLTHMLDHLLRGLEKIFPGYHAGLLEINKSGKLLNHLSSPSLPSKYREQLIDIPIGPEAASCGTASFIKKPVFVSDIETDPLWKYCNQTALEAGFRSCWSFPVMDSKGEVMGSLGIYLSEKKLPSADEIKKLERFSYLISVLLEHQRIAQSIQLSDEIYKTVLRATNDAIWDYDLQTKVMQWGYSLKKLFGHDSENKPYTLFDWIDDIHPEDRNRATSTFNTVINSDNLHYWEDEYRFKKADGDYAYVYDRGMIIRDENGKGARMIGAMQDITERKKSEFILKELNETLARRAAELEASNAELEKFAYIASHDLKEPLRMISSFLQLFESKYKDIVDAKGQEYIRFAVDGAERMKELINDLLEYSRLLKNETEPEWFNPSTEVEEVCRMFSSEIKLSNAKISFAQLPDIYANRNQFLQLMQNLVGNAIKYKSDQDPQIKISCRPNQTHWEFVVHDNGIGIEKEYHQKIFDMFQRLQSRSKYSGTGIGLAICRKITELHGGSIYVESEKGKGSSFIFTIRKPKS